MPLPRPTREHASAAVLPLQVGLNSEAGQNHRTRALRPWRIALIMYCLALTVATHWPRLRLGPEVPASDKMLHLLAFGALTLLLWRSGWFGPRWLVMLIAIAWAALDEVSQGIPILQRTVTWYDLVANVCGVVCAMALLWAMGPLQSSEQLAGPDRSRARLFEYTFDDMFARWKPWLIGFASAMVCAMAILLARPLLPSPRAVGVFGLIAVLIAAHALYLVYRRIFFRNLQRVQRAQPCLACGAAAKADANECGMCGQARSAADYELTSRPPLSAVLRISLFPAMVAFVGVVALFALVLLLPIVYGWSITTPPANRYMPRLAQLAGRMPPELSSAVDLTVYMLLIALVVRLWRRRFAAYVDQSVRCRKCGHDLHGTPINERGEGHCGECGAAFVREVNAESTEHTGKGLKPQTHADERR